MDDNNFIYLDELYPAHLPTMPMIISHRGVDHTFLLRRSDTLYDLSLLLSEPPLSVPVANQKFIIQPGPGFIRPPTAQTSEGDPLHLPLSQLRVGNTGLGVGPGGRQRKITLLGATAQQVADLTREITRARGAHPDAGNREAFLAARGRARGARAARAAADREAQIEARADDPTMGGLLGRDGQPIRPPRGSAPRYGRGPMRPAIADVSSMSDNFGFGSVRALSGFADVERARSLLDALREDRGIREAMRRWQFRVGMLVEMDPAENTTAQSRTLGLNRNRGQVIELRLRTDRYDGFRHYNGIRRTLCHELAHNTWGDHDENFWRLCREIEAFVQQQSWNVGRRIGGDAEDFYQPPEGEGDDDYDDDHVDAGGWTGGTHVLGGGATPPPLAGATRAEMLAQAAERRRAALGADGESLRPRVLMVAENGVEWTDEERAAFQRRYAARRPPRRPDEGAPDGGANGTT
jgi:hypothetical protein